MINEAPWPWKETVYPRFVLSDEVSIVLSLAYHKWMQIQRDIQGDVVATILASMGVSNTIGMLLRTGFILFKFV
jgi:hypothetical protein